jgi:hypothetical protein
VGLVGGCLMVCKQVVVEAVWPNVLYDGILKSSKFFFQLEERDRRF